MDNVQTQNNCSQYTSCFKLSRLAQAVSTWVYDVTASKSRDSNSNYAMIAIFIISNSLFIKSHYHTTLGVWGTDNVVKYIKIGPENFLRK
jgi:hypothetical protein